MAQYMPNFRKNAIDGAELQSLNHETLQNALGICKDTIIFLFLFAKVLFVKTSNICYTTFSIC